MANVGERPKKVETSYTSVIWPLNTKCSGPNMQTGMTFTKIISTGQTEHRP